MIELLQTVGGLTEVSEIHTFTGYRERPDGSMGTETTVVIRDTGPADIHRWNVSATDEEGHAIHSNEYDADLDTAILTLRWYELDVTDTPRDSPPSIPSVGMPTRTLLREGSDQILWVDGLFVLPVGSRINLDNLSGHSQLPLPPERFPSGHADAIVTGLNVWGMMSAGRILVLEVQLVPVGEAALPPL